MITTKKKIAFLMPFAGAVPVGGFKVVYEYANRLVADGYQVDIVYPAILFFHQSSFFRKCKGVLRFLYKRIIGNYTASHWFSLDKRVGEHWVFSLSEKLVPRADIYVATAVRTSEYLNRYKRIPSRCKLYMIQGFENWNYATEKVIGSYRYPLRKIVIAEWLEQIVHEAGENCVLIHNGFDFDRFTKDVDFACKNRFCVVMLYHTAEGKGCADGFKALEIVKSKYPQLEVNLFGVYPRPRDLPEWYHYYRKPDRQSHNRIYNEAAIFLGPSHNEGFCLTPPEAMQCGCAVVCTDIGGYTVICKNDRTALVGPPHDPEAMAQNIIRLIEDDRLRLRIAEAGYNEVQRFTWDKAYSKFRNEIAS